MKLLRFALLTFDSPPEDWKEWILDSGEVHLQPEWARETESGGLEVFVVASVGLPEKPEVNEDGLVVVPNVPLKQLEALIETAANLVAVSERVKRSIASPMPAVAFLAEDEQTLAWLDSTNGILRTGYQTAQVGGVRIDYDTMLKLSEDRTDGVALLAEALSHQHSTGVFHEFMRLFERAFRLGPYKLVEPLAEFLAGAESMGYTKPEVERWLIELRHPATHADRRPDFVLESDVRPVIPRMTQAAYEVLFNKENWRSPSSQRRNLWRPPGGTSGESYNGFYMVRGHPAKLEFQMFDEVGSYPRSLETGFKRALPPKIWTKWPSEDEGNDVQLGTIHPTTE